MAASRTVLLKTGWITDIGTISALVTCAGVVGSLVWFWAVRHTFLRFLFERPARFWIAPKAAKSGAEIAGATARKRFALQGAE
jgi:hypothetical protein